MGKNSGENYRSDAERNIITMVDSALVVTEKEDVMAKPLRKNGVDVSLISPDRADNIIKRYCQTSLNIIWLLFTRQPNVIYSDGEYGFISVVLGRLFRTQTFVRLPGNIWFETKSSYETAKANDQYMLSIVFYFGYLMNYTLRYATGIITVSRDLKQKAIRDYSIPPSKVTTIPVPIEYEVPLEENNCDKTTLLTVTDAKFQPKKEGLRDCIKISSEVLAKVPEAEYRVAFDGAEKSDIIHWIDKYSPNEDVKSRIKCLGYVSNISREYARADIFLYISYLDGYPSVILEAQSAALPVITNADFGMIDQIAEGDCGFLVDNRDLPSQAITKTLKLCKNKELRKSMGYNGYDRVNSNNDYKTIGRKLIQEFDQI